MYLVTSASEFGYDVFRQELCVAASYVNICVFNMQQAVQYILELVKHLNFIQQDVVHPSVLNPAFHILVKRFRVAVLPVSVVIESHFYDMVLVYAFGFKMTFEEVE